MPMLKTALLVASAGLISATSSATPSPQSIVSAAVRQRLHAAPAIAIAGFQQVKQRLAITDDGKPVSLTNYVLPVAITDPDGKTESVAKILLDPTYLSPSRGQNDPDFIMEIRSVKKVGSRNAYSGLAFCRWEPGKVKAVCPIDAGDSSYELRVLTRKATLKSSGFAIPVTAAGFALATYDNANGAAAIKVRSKSRTPVNVSLTFN